MTIIITFCSRQNVSRPRISPNCETTSSERSPRIVRDVFLVGYYMAQRFSDYSTINEDNIRTLESGQRVIDLKHQKTGNHVVIPVRPELQTILDKYENQLPKSYEQKVNKFLKQVTREAGITEKNRGIIRRKLRKEDTSGRKVRLGKDPHGTPQRRTMYLAGIPTIAIIKITGHKTEKEFMKYITIQKNRRRWS